MDLKSIKRHGGSRTLSLEDEEEIAGEHEDEKEQIKELRESSFGSVGFTRHSGEMANYNSYSEEETEEGGPGTKTGAFPS